jgi:hypothetical protein
MSAMSGCGVGITVFPSAIGMEKTQRGVDCCGAS